MKKVMLGHEAVARGLYEAGVRFISSYPGTPSTEISEIAAKYDEIYTEWAPNEKVAMEAALDASAVGGRSFCAMKHVGLNIAADPLFITAYTGINGGFVIGVADDFGTHPSQNEEGNHHCAIAAKLPIIDPSDAAECKEFVKLAYDYSEQFSIPFILRLTTRVSHSGSPVKICERQEYLLREYAQDAVKQATPPGNARLRLAAAEQRLKNLADFAYDCSFNRIERGSGTIGVITTGNCYNHAKEVYGESASYLKLGLIHPLSSRLIREFADCAKTIIVTEEPDGAIEVFCRSVGVCVTSMEKEPSFSASNAARIGIAAHIPECHSEILRNTAETCIPAKEKNQPMCH